MYIYHIPVHTYDRKDCEALHIDYLMRGDIGSGAFGKVYEACIRGTSDCGYVLKVITYDHKKYKREGGKSLERFWRDWKNETSIFRKLNRCQVKYNLVFSPKLYDSWYCNKGAKVYFYILMERYDGDLLRLLSRTETLAISMALDRMESYLAIIHYNSRICLNDIKLQNILYKKIGPNEYHLVFADFGIATMNSDDDCIKIDRENFIEVKKEFSPSIFTKTNSMWPFAQQRIMSRLMK